MKAFVAVVCFALIANAWCAAVELTDAQQTEAKRNGEECAKELELTEEETTKLKARDYSNPTQNIKCFAKCFYERAGSLKDGVLQEDTILTKFGPLLGEERTRTILDKCRDIKDEDKCEMAFKLHECVEKVRKETEAAEVAKVAEVVEVAEEVKA